jgi:tRNA A37 threonylcarbamoyladenosine biosynthesis protein TsaE
MVIYYIYENYEFNFIHFDYWRIKLDNTVVFHKLAALLSSMVLHEWAKATTEAVVDAL